MCFQNPMLSTSTSEFCSICKAPTTVSRYGVLACLACHVFFRRTVLNKKVLKCHRKLGCFIGYARKRCCKKCRFLKCIKAGMNPKLVQNRDKIGPRMIKKEIGFNINPDLKNLLRLQTKQRYQHQRYCSYNTTVDSIEIKGKFYCRANRNDIKSVLNLGFQHAIEWIHHLESFFGVIRNRNESLSENGIGLILIDQAYKTANETDKETVWFIQNNTFLHEDYFCQMASMGLYNEKQAKIHYEFVNDLIHSLSNPFRRMKIDSFECVFLKSLLFLSPLPSRNVCLSQLMKYIEFTSFESRSERFGELLLLLGNIRCAIKSFYNHTKVSDLFDFNNFDSYVRNKMFT